MKEIKLIKVGEHYDLYHRIAEENLIIGFASTDNTFENKLSLKNCQEIENGYDLYDLAKTSMNKINILFNHSLDSKSHTIGFRAGWQHALKILGDKKYSQDDMKKAYVEGYLDEHSFEVVIQSLQQTEWDVEIVGSGTIYKTVLDCCPNYHPKFGCGKKDDCSCKNCEIPKLDANGCLILKRKI